MERLLLKTLISAFFSFLAASTAKSEGPTMGVLRNSLAEQFGLSSDDIIFHELELSRKEKRYNPTIYLNVRCTTVTGVTHPMTLVAGEAGSVFTPDWREEFESIRMRADERGVSSPVELHEMPDGAQVYQGFILGGKDGGVANTFIVFPDKRLEVRIIIKTVFADDTEISKAPAKYNAIFDAKRTYKEMATFYYQLGTTVIAAAEPVINDVRAKSGAAGLSTASTPETSSEHSKMIESETGFRGHLWPWLIALVAVILLLFLIRRLRRRKRG
jgi:hypothetical protein